MYAAFFNLHAICKKNERFGVYIDNFSNKKNGTRFFFSDKYQASPSKNLNSASFDLNFLFPYTSKNADNCELITSYLTIKCSKYMLVVIN